MQRILVFSIYLILLPVTFTHAADIEEKLPGGLIAEAVYHPGNPDKPAILLLHGFLTVHHFNLIKNVADEIASEHYSVLVPTLTLGISKRKTTLDCNALHLHNMENDLKEIDWWVNWLIKKGHKNIILMGHSSGAMQLAIYASTYKHKEISKLVGLSIIPLADNKNSQFVTSRNVAANMIREQNNDIMSFTLAYCVENYSAPAREYMSYAKWDATSVLNALNSINMDKVIIMGGDDIPVYENWNDDIKSTGTSIDVIEGADHFFGNGTEFELYDSIRQALTHQ